MGLWDKLRGELIDIVEFLDAGEETLAYRFERYGNEIKNNAKLVVRPGQVAVFVNEGQFADICEPGTYELNTKNVPILATLKGWKYGFESPFKAEVYFISTNSFLDLKWGTRNPIILRDPEIGPIRVRAFGTYQIRVSEPKAFMSRLVATDEHYTIDELAPQMRNIIVTRFSNMIASAELSALDMAANIDQLSEMLHKKLVPEVAAYGIDLEKLLIENISLPPGVEEMLDKRSSMGLVGDLGQFARFQAAVSIEKATENEGMGGLAAGGMGAGLGLAMAQQMGNTMLPGANPPATAPAAAPGMAGPPPLPGGATIWVVVNGQPQGPLGTAQLPPLVATGQLRPDTLVWQQGMGQWQAAGQTPGVSQLFSGPTPPPVPPGGGVPPAQP